MAKTPGQSLSAKSKALQTGQILERVDFAGGETLARNGQIFPLRKNAQPWMMRRAGKGFFILHLP